MTQTLCAPARYAATEGDRHAAMTDTLIALQPHAIAAAAARVVSVVVLTTPHVLTAAAPITDHVVAPWRPNLYRALPRTSK